MHSKYDATPALIAQAAIELEQLRKTGSCNHFPSACRLLLRSAPGNTQCADCGTPNPDWASVTFGSLYCLNCSGRHRSYGVQTSVVRSVDMDAWTHTQVLSVLEGGNGQLEGFLDRHCLGRTSDKANCRYHTKAARFYKTHLKQHVMLVADAGVYRGREASRSLHQQQRPKQPAEPTCVVRRRVSSSSQPISVQ
jgi:hypothetical protein